MRFEDLKDIRKKSPLFDELCCLAVKYREDIRKFDELDRVIYDNGKFKPTIDLGLELKKCRILNRFWLERNILLPVRKETENFIRRMCSGLREKEEPCRSSQNEARHTFYEFKLIPELAAVISSAVIEAVLSSEEGDLNIRRRVLNELDVLWGEICTTIIEGERKSLEYDQPSIKKLSAFVLRLIQMNANGRSGKALYATASLEFSGISHTFHRIVTDEWFTASRVSSAAELFIICTRREFNVDDEKRISDWVVKHATPFYNALCIDYTRIDEIRSKCEFSEEWHGLNLKDCSADPSTDSLLTPPSYLGFFNSETGRVYACSNAAGSSAFRVVGVVRCLFVMRRLISDEFFEIGKFDTEYARNIINIEKQHIIYKTSDIASKMLLICEDSDVSISAQQINDFIDDLLVNHRSGAESSNQSRPAISASAVCAVPTSSSMFSEIPLVNNNRRGVDFFVRPHAKLKFVEYRPSRVQRSLLLEYTIVFTIAHCLNEILSTRRSFVDIAAIGISNSILVENVASNIQKLHDIKGSSTSRVFENGILNRTSLTQIVSNTVRRLIKAGAEASAFAQKAGATDAISWTSNYQTTKSNTELILHVGLSVRDPACYLFLDVCVRVKTLLDESWPLPSGMNWTKMSHRRGKSRQATSDDGNNTASTLAL